MELFLNELSFVGQAESPIDFLALISELPKIVRGLKPIMGSTPLRTHFSLGQQEVRRGQTFFSWLTQQPKGSPIKELLIALTTKGPFVDEQRLTICSCYLQEQNVSHSSVAAAAYSAAGHLVGLPKTPLFTPLHLQLHFHCPNDSVQSKEIFNITNESQIWHLRRRYVPSLKHDPHKPTIGVRGSAMDLEDRVAQEVLDGGVVSGKQVYGFYRWQFYEFQPDNVGGYHGYPIPEQNVPNEVRKRLRGG